MMRKFFAARPVLAGMAIFALLATPAAAGDAVDGWRWKAESTEINPEGIFWNDFLVDGQDRWKSGGITQSYTVPERVFETQPWTPWRDDRASGIEVQLRGLVVTPDNTAAPRLGPEDRPYAQYLGLGGYLRSDTRPRPAPLGTTMGIEDRVGVELGWIGEPLFFFDAQDQLHGMIGMGETHATEGNTVGDGVLANLEARRTLRFHRDMGAADVALAPYVDLSLGMRQTSARVGVNGFVGDDLSARHWNMDSATGAVIPGAWQARPGPHWALFAGADIGAVANDALLGGTAGLSGPSAEPEPVVARARAGLVVGWGRVAVSYGVAWLSPEFEGQGDGQLIGAVAVKLPF